MTVGTIQRVISSTDTCLLVPSTARTELIVQAEGFQTVRLLFRPDTLPPGRYLSIRMEAAVTQLREVEVRPNDRIRYRGDTLIIATDSLPTRPHARATELLNRLPGASLDAEGNLQIMGKRVDEVTVDGKPLFGGNAGATLDALRADMITQLEVIPTGRSTTDRATMNIALKPDRKQGAYGEAGGLAGTAVGTRGRCASTASRRAASRTAFFPPTTPTSACSRRRTNSVSC